MKPVEARTAGDGERYTERFEIFVCDLCGWWFASKEEIVATCYSERDAPRQHVRASGAALAAYDSFGDPATLHALRVEVQRHVVGRGPSNEWDAMEDATIAVLRSFGYSIRATARSRDGGVDAILDHVSRGTVFIQVKHSMNEVGVDVFRNLVGTMCLDGVHNGILVTSSRFTSGVDGLVAKAGAVGLAVELVDGPRFLAALDLTARLAPPTFDDVLKVAKPETEIIDRQIEV